VAAGPMGAPEVEEVSEVVATPVEHAR